MLLVRRGEGLPGAGEAFSGAGDGLPGAVVAGSAVAAEETISAIVQFRVLRGSSRRGGFATQQAVKVQPRAGSQAQICWALARFDERKDATLFERLIR